MTVKELFEKLELCDPDAKILSWDVVGDVSELIELDCESTNDAVWVIGVTDDRS